MKVPNKMNITPSVAAFEAAWFLVYTSGNLMTPKVAIRQSTAPAKIKNPMRILMISLTFNNNPLFQILSKRHCSDKGKDTN